MIYSTGSMLESVATNTLQYIAYSKNMECNSILYLV